MKLPAKIAIVVALIIAVGILIAAKNDWFSSGSIMTPSSAAESTAAAGLADVSVIGRGKPVLLELGSDQCMQCKTMFPILHQLSQEHPGQFVVAFNDVWKDSTVSEKYGVQIIPTQIFFDKDGKELFRHEGFFPKEDILAKWKELDL